jgi:class 3 adenylate cyclase
MRTSPAGAVPPRLRSLELFWRDTALEADYRRWRAEEALPFVRTAMYASAAGWVLFAVASFWLGTEFQLLVIPVTAAMLPLLAAVVAMTYRPRARRYGLLASGAANLVAGLAVVAIFELAGSAVGGSGYTDIGVGAVVLLVFFGCTIMRLPPGLAAAAITPYVAAQQVLLVQAFAGDLARQVGFTTLLLISVLSGLLLSAVLDRVSRNAFRQERLIATQRRAIEEERARSERLLLNILPAPIADELKTRPGTIAETHDAVTVLFADLVGFTALASEMSARSIVERLNEVFTRFDELAGEHGIEKIKTIGDAYMAVAGLPSPRPDHTEAAADLALAIRDELHIRAAAGEAPFDYRIGIHTGPVVAGVIGHTKFAYDLWGDTVNVAARMESHGVTGQIQVTDATAESLLERGYALRERGLVEVKGKGPLRTWFLDGAPERGTDVGQHTASVETPRT